MTLTVATLAARPELGLTLLAARRAAGTTPVEWAHAIDRVDSDRWIAPGTLVLTAGFQLPDDAPGLADHLDRLRRAGACALAVDTGGRWDSVPAALVERGAETGFPVLAVDPDIPFTTVVRAVAESVTASKVRSLSELLEAEATLVRMLLRDGVARVLQELGDRLAASCAVVNNRGAILASAGDPGDVAVMVPAPPFHPVVGRSALHADGARMIQPLTGAEIVQGALVVDSVRRFTEADRVLVNHAAGLVSLSMSRSLAVHDAEERLRREAMRAIMAGRVPTPEQLKLFGLTPATPVTALVVSGTELGDAQLAEELAGLGCAFLHETVLAGHAIVHDGPEDVAAVLHARLSRPGQRVRIGVGETMDLSVVDLSLRQATLAVPRQGSGVRSIRDMPAHELLIGLLDDDAADLLAGGLHRRLTEHDARTGDGLAAAAAAYVESNGRFEAMARRLGVHRQTARTRARRVEEVIGASLEDPDIRAELWLAMRATGRPDIR